MANFSEPPDMTKKDEIIELIEILTDIANNIERLISNSVTISSVGYVMSVLGLTLVTATWILFQKTRNIQNFILWMQCLASTLESVATWAVFFCTYRLQFVDERPEMEKRSLLMNIKYVDLINDFLGNTLCCWTAAAAVLCYVRVVKVFHTDTAGQYLIVTLCCWGIPVPGLIYCIVQFYKYRTFDVGSKAVTLAPYIIMLVMTAVIYSTVIWTLLRSKRPGMAETVKTFAISIVICIDFGFNIAVNWVASLYFNFGDTSGEVNMEELRRSHRVFDYMPWFYFTYALITSYAFVLAMFYVVVRKEPRTLWLDLVLRRTPVRNPY